MFSANHGCALYSSRKLRKLRQLFSIGGISLFLNTFSLGRDGGIGFKARPTPR
jgi:hypothetical protein